MQNRCKRDMVVRGYTGPSRVRSDPATRPLSRPYALREILPLNGHMIFPLSAKVGELSFPRFAESQKFSARC